MKQTIILWDNDGTITGSQNPDDKTSNAKIILPGVKETMKTAKFNFIISGFKSAESETKSFDPKEIISRFSKLMNELPISAAVFSPAIGGVACYVVINKQNQIIVEEAHKNPRYKKYIGKFKKPNIGMLAVIKDVAQEEFGQIIDGKNTVMIGDTWHDEAAAKTFGIPFISAKIVHSCRML